MLTAVFFCMISTAQPIRCGMLEERFETMEECSEAAVAAINSGSFIPSRTSYRCMRDGEE